MALNEIDLGGNTIVVKDIKVGATAPGQAGTSLSSTELTLIDGVTAGTVIASKVVTVDASLDTTGIRNAVLTNLDAGASGTAGTVDIFPTTASKGKIQIAAADSAGNTTTTITNASQTTTGIMTIPDTNGNASFVMTAAAQTVGGAKTFSSNPVLGAGTTIDLDSAPATLSSNAATITKYAAVVTTESLTTAAGASQALVLTLSGVAAGDLAFVTRAGGTNTRRSFALDAVTSTNTVTVTLYNNEPTNAINGTVIFNVWILKA